MNSFVVCRILNIRRIGDVDWRKKNVHGVLCQKNKIKNFLRTLMPKKGTGSKWKVLSKKKLILKLHFLKDPILLIFHPLYNSLIVMLNTLIRVMFLRFFGSQRTNLNVE